MILADRYHYTGADAGGNLTSFRNAPAVFRNEAGEVLRVNAG